MMPKTATGNRIIAAKAKPKPRPQTTLVTVAVTTAGPVTMKAVREWVNDRLDWYQPDEIVDRDIAGNDVTKITVKRDANIERPRR